MNTQTLSQKLLKVQKTIGALVKSSDNPFFKSKFADLNQALSVAKAALLPEGLFLVQGPGITEAGNKYIETTIIDSESGQSVNCRVPFSGNEKNMQEIGAATTYGRRFGIVSLLALEQEDDDGETAVGRGTKTGAIKSGSGSSSIRAGNGTNTTQPLNKTNPPVQPESKSGPTRKTINEKISLTSKVIIDSKRATQDEVVALLTAFNVKTKEELTDVQAKTLLTQLEGKLK